MMGEKIKNERQFELDKQLHEQYAINNNANINSFISFIVALLVLFGAFGYAYIYSDNGFYISCCCQKEILPIEAFFLLSLVVGGILCFLGLMALQLGFAHRRDQIIICNIRRFYYNKENLKTIFGKNYQAIGKKFWDFIPDFYNLFYWLFVCAQLFVFILTIIKGIPFCNIWQFWIAFVCHIVFIFWNIIQRKITFIKYLKLIYPVALSNKSWIKIYTQFILKNSINTP